MQFFLHALCTIFFNSEIVLQVSPSPLISLLSGAAHVAVRLAQQRGEGLRVGLVLSRYAVRDRAVDDSDAGAARGHAEITWWVVPVGSRCE